MSNCSEPAISERNHLILFMSEMRLEDENGDMQVKMSEVGKEWAHVKPVRASEEERYGELRDIRVNLFTFPRIEGLKADWRIIWNGREHNIEEIRDPGPGGEYMVVKGISGVAQ